MNRTRGEFRSAQLQAKRNAEIAKRKERELLFSRSANAEGPRQPSEKLTQDDVVVNASSDVTAALKRTYELMQAELSKSQFAQQTLGWFSHFYIVFLVNLLSQNNQLLLWHLCQNPTVASTPCYHPPAHSSTLFSVRRNQTPGTLKPHSTSSLAPSPGFYFAVCYTDLFGGLSGCRLN